MSKKQNLREIIWYFTADKSVLPPDLCQIILQLSGHLRVSKRSVMYYTYYRPISRYPSLRFHRVLNPCEKT